MSSKRKKPQYPRSSKAVTENNTSIRKVDLCSCEMLMPDGSRREFQIGESKLDSFVAAMRRGLSGNPRDIETQRCYGLRNAMAAINDHFGVSAMYCGGTDHSHVVVVTPSGVEILAFTMLPDGACWYVDEVVSQDNVWQAVANVIAQSQPKATGQGKVQQGESDGNNAGCPGYRIASEDEGAQADVYAAVGWAVGDIKKYCPKWSDQQCREFLTKNGEFIMEAMAETGREIIGYLIHEADEETPLWRVAGAGEEVEA